MKDKIYSEDRIPGFLTKYYNLQIGYYDQKDEQTNIFNFRFSWDRRHDHAGFQFTVEIWNLYFMFYTYDKRHWCEKCNSWTDLDCDDDHE